jgi:hypothetical protein
MATSWSKGNGHVSLKLWKRTESLLTLDSVIDRETQYFIAGAIRDGTVEDSSVFYDGTWFGSDTAPTPGGLCEVCRNSYH